jgi:hypothetical protein
MGWYQPGMKEGEKICERYMADLRVRTSQVSIDAATRATINPQ